MLESRSSWAQNAALAMRIYIGLVCVFILLRWVLVNTLWIRFGVSESRHPEYVLISNSTTECRVWSCGVFECSILLSSSISEEVWKVFSDD